MSRTGKNIVQTIPASMLVVLGFLACCLTVHFLVEDLVFLSVQPDAVQQAVSYDELTHQDDTALAMSHPARVSTSSTWLMIPVLLPSRVQAFSPPHQPPKILIAIS